MKLLLFDLDGTLVSTGGAGIRALDRAFAELHGLPRAMEGISPAGNMDPLIVKEIFAKKIGREAAPQDVDGVCEAYLRFLAEELKTLPRYRVMPGIPEILAALACRQDLVLALGTGNWERGARIKLAPADLNRYFSFGGFATDAEKRPGMLEAAMRKAAAATGVEFPRASVFVIGDTVHDVRAGKAVGAVTVAVECGHGNREELLAEKPDVFMEDFKNAGELLKRIG